MECKVYSVECRVGSVERRVLSLKCEAGCVEYGV